MDSISKEIAKWDSKTKTKLITFIKRDIDSSSLIFEIGDNVITIYYPAMYPNHTSGSLYIEYDNKNKSLEWLDYITVYIDAKRPSLYKLLKKLDSESVNNVVEKKETGLDDSKILELYNKLETNINKCGSSFTVKNISKTLFDKTTTGTMLLKEFIELYKKYYNNNNITITPVDDNIYIWNIKFKYNNERLFTDLKKVNDKFGYNYIEFELHFHDIYYPLYPPVLRYIRPRLNNCLMHRLANINLINMEFWSSTRTLSNVINELYKIIEKHADIDIDCHMNDKTLHPHGAYIEFENKLLKLAPYCGAKTFDDMDITVYKKNTKINTKTNTKEKKNGPWAGGTGYGHSGAAKWDIDSYIKSENEKNKLLASILEELLVEIQNYPIDKIQELYKLVNNSYLMSLIQSYLANSTILEMDSKTEIYNTIFMILQNFANEDAIFLFNNTYNSVCIYDTFKNLYLKATKIKKMQKNDDFDSTDLNNTIIVLFEMIEPIFVTYISTLDVSKISNNNDSDAKKETEKKDTYESIMKDFLFDECSILKSNNYTYIKNVNDSSAPKRKFHKKVSIEFSALEDSLPLNKHASIFFRHDEANMMVCKALVTGPADTPYDSGCFIFDIFLKPTYPDGPPLVKFINTGNQRFNPNLYAGGKVCLSLLGTWEGTKNEQWTSKSTLIQVLNSIQSLILIEHPYFNEPGYQNDIGTKTGDKESKNYNNNIRLYTMRHAMSDLIENPLKYTGFEKIIKNHFKLKKDHILNIAKKWVDESFDTTKQMYEKEFDRLNKNLSMI